MSAAGLVRTNGRLAVVGLARTKARLGAAASPAPNARLGAASIIEGRSPHRYGEKARRHRPPHGLCPAASTGGGGEDLEEGAAGWCRSGGLGSWSRG